MGPLQLLESWLKQVQDTGMVAPVESEKTQAMQKGIRFEESWIFSGTAVGASEQVMIIVDDEYDAHAKIQVEVGGDAVFEMYENPTITSSGTQQDPRNLNRTFGIQGTERNRSLGFVSPTLSADGYLLTHRFVPDGVGFGSSLDDEWVLRRGNAYIFRVYNWNTQAAEVIAIRAKWIEKQNSPAIDGGHPG